MQTFRSVGLSDVSVIFDIPSEPTGLYQVQTIPCNPLCLPPVPALPSISSCLPLFLGISLQKKCWDSAFSWISALIPFLGETILSGKLRLRNDTRRRNHGKTKGILRGSSLPYQNIRMGSTGIDELILANANSKAFLPLPLRIPTLFCRRGPRKNIQGIAGGMKFFLGAEFSLLINRGPEG